MLRVYPSQGREHGYTRTQVSKNQPHPSRAGGAGGDDWAGRRRELGCRYRSHTRDVAGPPRGGVLVEPLDPDVERAGLTTLQLQTAVEGQLRKAGIPLFTTEDRVSVPG